MAGRRELRVDEDGLGGLGGKGAGLGWKLKEVWGELEPEEGEEAAAGTGATLEVQASRLVRKVSTEEKSIRRCCLMSSRVELCCCVEAINPPWRLVKQERVFKSWEDGESRERERGEKIQV